MIWLVTIPLVVFFTLKNMIEGNWLMFHTHGNWDGPTPPFYQWPFLGIVFTIFVGLLISAFIIGMVLTIPMVIGSIPDRFGIKDVDYPLIALREKDGIVGASYFLGSGYIEDRQYYFWYRKNTDGSVSGGKTTRVPGVKIFDVKDGQAPFMRTYRTKYVEGSLAESWWWFLVAIDIRSDTDWCDDFFIPAGSIKEGYAL